MPSLVDNIMTITGSRMDIAHLLYHCFTAWEPDGDPELDFERIIPLQGEGECALPYWGTRKNALETVIMKKWPDSLVLWLRTASSTPDPVYLKLGELYPSLQFHIMAADPGNGRAVIIRVTGKDAVFDDVDFYTVYELIYGEPPPDSGTDEEWL
ncbi:hypothetical protein [Microvirga makkahensis]|uniref:YubB ferredoxin-like domain-containing protein n=1 Tax=Microvirga makkahensis TaxID=1128670 RepID=A0A7X3SMK1_9HYPH|nr:hypothetical protein [Microvirga makkahensis]MXQ10457.1 hypothetical protein [Microvirga makkahensis]